MDNIFKANAADTDQAYFVRIIEDGVGQRNRFGAKVIGKIGARRGESLTAQ